MKIKNYFLFALALFFFVACKEEPNSFSGKTVKYGTAKYYHPFLGLKDDTIILQKKLKYEFNDYAFDEKSFVTIELVDLDQKLITDKNIQLFVDSIFVNNNTFKVDGIISKAGKLNIGIRILPNFGDGVISGFLKIKNHNLDIINNNNLNNSNEARIFKWEAEQDIIMNPLKKGLIILLILIVVTLLIWFVFIRNLVFPKMKRGKIVINSPYYNSINIKGARKVVFTKQPTKQKRLHEIFAGKIYYEVNNIWESEILIVPARQKSLRIRMGLGYTITPFSSSLKQGGSYELRKESEIINLTYL